MGEKTEETMAMSLRELLVEPEVEAGVGSI